MNAEEGASIRAVRRVYAEKAGIPFEAGARTQRHLRHRPGQSNPATKPPRWKLSAAWAKSSATRWRRR